MTETLANEPKWLTTDDIARLRKCSRWTAVRWVRRVQKKKPDSVKKKGRGLVVLREVVASLLADSRPPIDPRIAEKLAELEDLVRVLDKRTVAHGTALTRLHAL